MVTLIAALTFAAEPTDVLSLPERRSGVILPDEYERDGVYELFAFYDPQLDAWRTSTFVYGLRYRSQIPHPVALRDVGALGTPSGEEDWRRVHVRIDGRAWVRERRDVTRYRWMVGYVGDVVSAEPICRMEDVEAGATWTTRVEKTPTGWFPECMARTGAHPIAWSNVEVLEESGEDALEVTFTVDALTKARVSSPFRELPSFDATVVDVD